MGIKKKILEAMGFFLEILQEKTLQTLEEVDANTTVGYWAGAGAVSELSNNLTSSLGGNKLIYNESEDAYYIQHGADAALKKLGSIPSFSLSGNLEYHTNTGSSGQLRISRANINIPESFSSIEITIKDAAGLGRVLLYDDNNNTLKTLTATSTAKTYTIIKNDYSTLKKIALVVGSGNLSSLSYTVTVYF